MAELITKVPHIIRYSQDRFTVEASRNNTDPYVVRKIAHLWVCQCPDFFHREKSICKHITRVIDALEHDRYEDKRDAKMLIAHAQCMLDKVIGGGMEDELPSEVYDDVFNAYSAIKAAHGMIE